jgi:hypothetical protein
VLIPQTSRCVGRQEERALAELAVLRLHPDDDVYMPITPMFHESM